MMENRAKWDRRFLELAELVGSWSRDPSTKVGAVIVDKDKRVVSLGFNGFPQGMCDSEHLYSVRDIKLSRVVHAEMNALIFAGRVPQGSTLYTYPLLPCDRCIVHMLQAGIRRFVSSATTFSQHEERWGEAMRRTKRYIEEVDGSWLLI